MLSSVDVLDVLAMRRTLVARADRCGRECA
jgi:hypothetical protein